jgi:hypothetical protein
VRATSGVKSRWWLSRIGLKGSAHLVERSACAFAQCNIVFSRLARRGGRSSPLVAKPLLPAQNRLGRLLSPPGQARQRVHKRSRRCVVQVQYGQYVHKSAYEEGQLDHEIGCMMSQSSSVARVAAWWPRSFVPARSKAPRTVHWPFRWRDTVVVSHG